jgi:hypothetical protein
LPFRYRGSRRESAVAQLFSLGRSTTAMKRTLKILLIAFGVLVLFAVGVVVYLRQPPDDGRTPAERRQIADACFAMLLSSLTNEVDPIKPDDPRVPEVIRALHPISIMVMPNFAVQIDGTGTPPEYFLMRLPGHTNTWVLCAGGPPIRFGPREILRIEHD